MILREFYKVSVFVPTEKLEEVKRSIESVCEVNYGNYKGVFWCSSPGEEQYTPLGSANPSSGSVNKVSKNSSVLLIFSIPRVSSLLTLVLEQGIATAHPWEEPVIYVDECLATNNCYE